MAGLYNYSAGSDTGIYLFMGKLFLLFFYFDLKLQYLNKLNIRSGYMLLYLTVVQSTAQLSAHLFPTKTASAVFTGLLVLATTYAGGFTIHLRQLPAYLSWTQTISPQRWLLPLLIADEYSADTLANTAANQLCRNKQVSVHRPKKAIVCTFV